MVVHSGNQWFLCIDVKAHERSFTEKDISHAEIKQYNPYYTPYPSVTRSGTTVRVPRGRTIIGTRRPVKWRTRHPITPNSDGALIGEEEPKQKPPKWRKIEHTGRGYRPGEALENWPSQQRTCPHAGHESHLPDHEGNSEAIRRRRSVNYGGRPRPVSRASMVWTAHASDCALLLPVELLSARFVDHMMVIAIMWFSRS